MEFNEEDVLGYECKHTVYMKGPVVNGRKHDLIFIKLNAHMKDGRIIPTTRYEIDYQRPFWITKEGFRNHNEKKEYEELSKLKEFRCNQSELVDSIKRAIRTPGRTLKEVCENPYIYGADITPTTLIKESYMRKYPGLNSINTVAVLDIETDVVYGTEEPILVSITFGDKAIIASTKMYRKGIPDFKAQLEKYYYERIKDVPEIDSRNIKVEIVDADTPLEAIEVVMAKAHEWKPDFISIWNINFDIPKIIETIDRYGGSVNDIFSDPSVPKPFRNVWYKEGPAQKVSVSGKMEPLHWADRWHTLYAPASFYFIDQGCVFRKTRMAKGREASYALDYILKKHTNVSKLKNELADTMTGLEWHKHMQVNEKLDYAVYNIVDCAACEVLDEEPKVRDLRLSISMSCGYSDYDKFSSQPRRTVDDLHFLCLELGYVIGTTPKDIETEYDKLTLSIKDWIITLPAHLLTETGLKLVRECPDLATLIFRAVYD